MKAPIILALRHVAFEDLGCFDLLLKQRGYRVEYRYPWDADSGALLRDADLSIVLGGPIGAYEDHAYPFLLDEIRTLNERLEMQRPTIGICLGAQLIARAMGARVFAGDRKEIGWAPIELTAAGRRSPLAALGEDEPVFHWHGDTFDVPGGCELLASTKAYRHQAFAMGDWLLAVQFHPELDARGIEAWLVGHACELQHSGIDLGSLRATSAHFGVAAKQRGARFLADWLRAPVSAG